ncbi:MAG TPA: cold shock domain-containing protein [Paracoccaceae bacterium]|nr:cold shock domain-containing protein [Paracoccaceae bacterium]
MIIKGQVKWFDAGKGFGFIVADGTQGDILLHANVLRNFGRSSVAEGSCIEFSAQETERGLQASEVLSITAPDIESLAAQKADEANIPEVPADVPLQPARVKWFDKAKGFGFANVFGTTDDVFLHIEIMRHYGLSDLQPGEAISVKVIAGPRGHLAGVVESWDYATRN